MNDYVRHRKLIISGPFIEELSYRLPPRKPKISVSPEDFDDKKSKESVNPDKITSSMYRSRSRLKRLIYANSGAWKDKNNCFIPAKFLTLTFQENVRDLKEANYYLTKFIQRLNYRFRNHLAEPLKYVCVPEFQARGAVHYHLVLFNFPFMDYVYKKLRDVWGGYRIELTTVKKSGDVGHIIDYISKYITKQAQDERFFGQKRYFASRGVKKPIEIRDDVAIELIRWHLQSFEKYKNVFSVPFIGDVAYSAYYLGNNRLIKSLPLDPYAINKIQEAENYE